MEEVLALFSSPGLGKGSVRAQERRGVRQHAG